MDNSIKLYEPGILNDKHPSKKKKHAQTIPGNKHVS